jgi:hypothetical protein
VNDAIGCAICCTIDDEWKATGAARGATDAWLLADGRATLLKALSNADGA